MGEFKIQKDSEINIVLLPAHLEMNHFDSVKQAYKQWLLEPEVTHVLDFEGLETLSNKIYPLLVAYSVELKNNDKSIYSIKMSSQIFKQIKNDGLETVLNPVKSLDIVKNKIAGSKKPVPINVEFINPFIKATIETIKVQANTQIEKGVPFLKNAKHSPEVAICGVINITSDQFKGNLSLMFGERTFLKIYENMLGEKHTAITEEIQDACGELLNIIFGQAKAILNKEKGYVIQKALPAVLRGKDIKVQQTTTAPVVVLPFKISDDEFYLEIVAEPN